MAQGRSTEIITMFKWIRTSRLSIKELSLCRMLLILQPRGCVASRSLCLHKHAARLVEFVLSDSTPKQAGRGLNAGAQEFDHPLFCSHMPLYSPLHGGM